MEVYFTTKFTKHMRKYLSSEQRRQLQTFVKRLKNGEQKGKLLRTPWLFKCKIQEKRFYYISDSAKSAFIAVSDKKYQRYTIQKMVAQESTWKDVLRNLDDISRS